MFNTHTENSYYKPCTTIHDYSLRGGVGIETNYAIHRTGARGVDWDQSDLAVDDSRDNREDDAKEEDTSFKTKGDVLRAIDDTKDFFLNHVVGGFDHLVKNLDALVEYADENDAWEDRVYGEPNSLVMELVQTMNAFGLPEVRDMGKLYEFSKRWFKDNRDKVLRTAAPFVALGNELKEILGED